MRRIWCACSAGQKECQEKRPLPRTCGRMRALGSSSPALRLPHQKPGVRDYLPWGSSQPTRLFKWVEGWWDLSFNCYDMTCVTPSFIIHFHLKRITGQIFTWDTFFNCQYFNIFTKCTLWNVCSCWKGKRTQNSREWTVLATAYECSLCFLFHTRETPDQHTKL